MKNRTRSSYYCLSDCFDQIKPRRKEEITPWSQRLAWMDRSERSGGGVTLSEREREYERERKRGRVRESE